MNQVRGLWQYLTAGKGPFSISPLEANAFVRTTPEQLAPDLQLHFAPIHISDDCVPDFYGSNTFPRNEDGWSILPTLLHPTNRGYVGLRSASPMDAPIIQPNFSSTEADQQLLLKGEKKALEINQMTALVRWKKRGLIPAEMASDDELMTHIQRLVETGCYPVGICRIGIDEGSVVDASVMPKIGSGNTDAPVIMIAEKAANLTLGRVPTSKAQVVKVMP